MKNKKELDLHEDMGISIFDEQVEEAETNIYYITSYHAPTGETYPQIVLKGNKDNEEGGLLYSCRAQDGLTILDMQNVGYRKMI